MLSILQIIILLQNFFCLTRDFFSVELLESICYAEITDICSIYHIGIKDFCLFACIWTNPRYCDHFLLCSPYGASSMYRQVLLVTVNYCLCSRLECQTNLYQNNLWRVVLYICCIIMYTVQGLHRGSFYSVNNLFL